MIVAMALAQGAGAALGVWLALKISPKHPILAAGIVGAVAPLVVEGLAALVRTPAGADPTGGAGYT